MSGSAAINSSAYWDLRFRTDWEALGGPSQTRFFWELAVEALPVWLFQSIVERGWSICDWGCALGEGASAWKSASPRSEVTGVDISESAISRARELYPECRFQTTALEVSGDLFDVMYVSNTLEHFELPFDVLRTLLSATRRFAIVVVPFRESPRIDEHAVTFDFDNVPTRMDGFALCAAKVVDASARPNSYWPGEQLMLVYRSLSEEMPEGVIADLRIERERIEAQQIEFERLQTTERERFKAELLDAELSRKKESEHFEKERERFAAALISAELLRKKELERTEAGHLAAEREKAELARRLDEAIRESAAAQRRSASLTEHLVLAEKLVSTIRNSRSWRITRPIRVAARTFRNGGLYAQDVASLTSVARTAFRRMPLPDGVKRRLRKIWIARIRPQDAGGAGPAFTVTEAGSVGDGVMPVSGSMPAIALAERTPGLPDYIVWGVIDWHFRIQRPQHLAREIAAAGHRTFYVSNNLVDDPVPGFRVEQLDDSARLFQVSLHAAGAPSIYSAAPSPDVQLRLRASLAQLRLWAGGARIVSLVQHPFWYPIARAQPNSQVVYDCMDHHDGFGNTASEIVSLEHELMREADLLVVTSEWLDRIGAERNARRALIRNAGEYNRFSIPPPEIYQDDQSRRIIGYYGAIAEWFDLGLVEAVARRFPDCLVLLVGADSCGASNRLGGLANIRFVGEVPYERLTYYLYSFDVCLLPFRVIDLTLATNPVKVYEYLAAGRSVVSVDLPELRQFGDLVATASDQGAFLQAIADVLDAPADTAMVKIRQEFAREQTWTRRAADLVAAIRAMPEPRVSVIVVTYNNLALTRSCLATLESRTDYMNFETIVVDNSSSDGTPIFLEQWAAGGLDRKIVLNSDNRGFAAANNQGLAIANGEYLVLLNNDTQVTDGWLRTLVRHLRADRSVGLIGPVTNNIGNEARVDVTYAETSDMPNEAARLTLPRAGFMFRLRTAAFFCAMMTRDVYQRVGPLDEAFGIGFFEDDDYCRRVEQIGLHVVCADDVFIHHHLSASFDKMKQSLRRELFERNRELYERKWGPWLPHRYRSSTLGQLRQGI